MKPKISVLMGIYNCASTLKQAVESIQNQTYENWELIMCDDGSTDSTYEIASDLAKKDERIVLIRNDRNYGLNRTLNNCFKHATGEYIARMDADDESLPERFERQIEYLQENENIHLVGCAMLFFDENGVWGENALKEFPDVNDVVLRVPVYHATMMTHKHCMEEVNGYSEDKRLIRVEDVDLWIKLFSRGYRFHNIREPLYKMRNDKNALNRRKYIYRINSVYARLKGCKNMNLNVKYYIKSFKPMVVGLVPAKLRARIRKGQYKAN